MLVRGGTPLVAAPETSGELLHPLLREVTLRKLRRDLESSRDYLFGAADIPQELYRTN